MKIGIVGKRFSGKTKLFESVSLVDVSNSSNLINISSIKVQDTNIDKLSSMFKPEKTTYAEFELIDYNRNLDSDNSNIGSSNLIARYRELDAIIINIGVIDDYEFVETEYNDIVSDLFLSDILMVENKLDRLKKSKHDKTEVLFYENLLKSFEENKKPNLDDFSKEEIKMLKTFAFFSFKPWIVAINVDEKLLNKECSFDFAHFVLSAEIEKEIASFDDEKEAKVFMNDLNIKESLRARFISKLYETLNLISFYTVGKDEVRAWSVQKGTNAKDAAGKIHTDIQRGFIRAETMRYEDYIKYKDDIKSKGLLQSQGKDYIVQNADIINFKFNV